MNYPFSGTNYPTLLYFRALGETLHALDVKMLGVHANLVRIVAQNSVVNINMIVMMVVLVMAVKL